MDFFRDLLTNHILICAGVSWLVAQIIKTVIYSVMEHKFVVSRLWGDGGMPSCHSATVCALALMAGLTEGFSSAIFGVAMIFAIVVMHDATGVRRETGKQAVTIKELVTVFNDMMKEKDQQIQTEKLKVLVGHTPLQVFFGALVGVVISIGYYFVFVFPYL